MIKKLLLRLTVLSLLLVHNSVWAVDYTQNANCMGAFLMEDDGDETDEAKGNTLTETGGDIPQSTTKKFGTYSRDFEADDTEYLEHADGLDTDITADISMVLWYKPENASPTTDEWLISKYNSTGNNKQYAVKLESTGDIIHCILSSDGNATATAIGATDISDEAWHHIAGVYNGTDIRVYIDGSLDSNGADNPKSYSSDMQDKSSEFNIGVVQSGASYVQFADGLIDDVGIFNDGLTSTEVNDIMDNGLTGAVVAAKPQLIMISN